VVTLWVEDVISRTTVYLDTDEARAAAERLAIRSAKVVKLVNYWDRTRALADLGLEA
jgi:hypothetical protein